MEHRGYCQGNLSEFTIGAGQVPVEVPVRSLPSLPGLWPPLQGGVIVDRTNLFVHLYNNAVGRYPPNKVCRLRCHDTKNWLLVATITTVDGACRRGARVTPIVAIDNAAGLRRHAAPRLG